MTTATRPDPHCAYTDPCDAADACVDRAADHAALVCGCERECAACGLTLATLSGAAVTEAAAYAARPVAGRVHRVHGHAYAAFPCPTADGPGCAVCTGPRAAHGWARW